MTDAFDTDIRSTLAVMVAEAPDPLSFDDLARQTAFPTTSRTSWTPGKAFTLAFAAVVIAIGAVALVLDTVDGGVAPADEVPASVTTILPETVTTTPPEALSLSGWSRISHNPDVFGEARMHSVVAGGPGFVAVGWTGSSPSEGHVDGDAAVWTSVDGITWTRVPHDDAVLGEAGMQDVTVGGPGLVAVGDVESGAAV